MKSHRIGLFEKILTTEDQRLKTEIISLEFTTLVARHGA